MKSIIFTATAALVLSACGGGSGAQAELEASCVESGESKEACSCMAKSLAKNLDKDQMKLVLKMSKAEASGNFEPTAAEAMSAMALMEPMMEAATSCSVGGL